MIVRFLILSFLLIPFSLFSAANSVETMFGATNIYGIAGEGGLTAAFSKEGELTVLRWPNPSFYELLNYITSNFSDAREMPHLGASSYMGGFGGVIFYHRGKRYVSELRNSSDWRVETTYLSPDAEILQHKFNNLAFPLKVIQIDLVDPETDVLAVAFKADYSSEITGVKFFFYLDPAISLKRREFIPTYAYEDDPDKGFLLFYMKNHSIFVDFTPHDPDSSKNLITRWKSIFNPNTTSYADVEEILGKGLYLVVGSNFPISSFQCGRDDVFSGNNESAYQDLKDGNLNNNYVSTFHENLAFTGNAQKDVWKAVFITAGFTVTDAVNRLNMLRRSQFEDVIERTQEWWEDFLSRANIPSDIPVAERNFIKRTIQTIRTSMDRKSGAIVASVATQPPYFLDWPRDGSFINYFLDTAGYHDLVLQHNLFYLKMQRKKDGEKALTPNSPAGTFAMNYYPDGMVGGPIDFEIDQTGLILWTWCTHGKFIKDPVEQREYYETFYPGIKLAAEALMKCYDQKTGLQCITNEDDNPMPTQGLQGAITEYLGLKSASEVAYYLGDEESARRWSERADELREAIYRNFYDIKLGRFNGNFDYYGNSGWAIWPVKLWDKNDPRWRGIVDFLFETLRNNILFPSPEGSAYDAKVSLGLDFILPAYDKRRTVLGTIIENLSTKLSTETLHVGEAYMPVYNDHTFKWQNVTSIPHVWEASLISLSVIAYYHPEILNLPALSKYKEETEGCSSLNPGRERNISSLFLLLLIIPIWRWYRWRKSG